MSASMRVALVVCLHGDEKLGLDAVRTLSSEFLANVDVFIGNPVALAHNKRFVQTDLNRCFPGKADGTVEERRAVFLRNTLALYDLVIDVHTTAANTKPFVIVTADAMLDSRVSSAALADIVVMPSSHAVGGSLLDHVRGFSLEFSESWSAEDIGEVLEETFANVRAQRDVSHTVYRGFATEVFNDPVPNFEILPGRVHNGKVVYAMLSGARSYKGKTVLAIRDD